MPRRTLIRKRSQALVTSARWIARQRVVKRRAVDRLGITILINLDQRWI